MANTQDRHKNKVTNAQRFMLDMLAMAGSLDELAMAINFGRLWRSVWNRLEERGLVRYAPYAKNGRYYQRGK